MMEPTLSPTFQTFFERLNRNRLPGEKAQCRMAPVPEHRQGIQERNSVYSRHSAVLVLCALHEPSALLYTLRGEHLPNHGGQLSFPGGRQETGETLLETACREAEEEVGIPPDRYKVAGCLSTLYVPPSGFVIHPYIAFCDKRPSLSVQPSEVSEAFWIDMHDLDDDKNIKTRREIIRENQLLIPYWDIHSVPLWGATAMITYEIITLYRNFIRQAAGN